MRVGGHRSIRPGRQFRGSYGNGLLKSEKREPSTH